MCEDQASTLLKGLGYNTVRLPREGLAPMLLLARGARGGTLFGELQHFVAASTATPPLVTMNKVAAEINGQSSSAFKASIGVSLLEAILKGFGLTGLKLGFAFNRASSIAFKFKNVLDDSIDPGSLSNYLEASTPRLTSLLIDHLDERGEAAILTSIIKSNSFEIITTKSNGASAEVDVDGIKGVLGVEGSVDVERVDERTISFSGNSYLTFGFQGLLLWIDLKSGTFKLRKPGNGGIGPMAFTAGGGPPSPLFDGGPVVLHTPRNQPED